MQIKMIETRRGSEDALSVKRFEAGLVYDVADTLARHFISHGWATEIESLIVTKNSGAGQGSAYAE